MLLLSCPTVAKASGSERCVFVSVQFRVRPWLILLHLPSVFFRVRPWLILLHLPSVFFRVRPWLILLLILLLNSVAFHKRITAIIREP